MDASLTPEQRALRGRIGAHTSSARTADRSARTALGRQAASDCFGCEVDPDGTLPPAERAHRVEHVKTADVSRLALCSARFHSKAAAARRAADELDADAAAAAAEHGDDPEGDTA